MLSGKVLHRFTGTQCLFIRMRMEVIGKQPKQEIERGRTIWKLPILKLA